MQRLRLFYERMGFLKSAICVLVIAYLGWLYSLLWSMPHGPVFVVSLLAIGIGLGCAFYPLISWNYLLAHRLINIARWVLFLGLLAIFHTQIRLPLLGTWSLHVFIWTLLTANFWLATYTPEFTFIDLRRMVDSLPDDDSSDDDSPDDAPADEKNWYRRH